MASSGMYALDENISGNITMNETACMVSGLCCQVAIATNSQPSPQPTTRQSTTAAVAPTTPAGRKPSSSTAASTTTTSCTSSRTASASVRATRTEDNAIGM